MKKSTSLANLTGPKLSHKSFFWRCPLGPSPVKWLKMTGWSALRAGQLAGEFRPITNRDIFNTFHFLWRLPCKIIKYNPRVKTRFEEGLLKKQKQTRPRHRFCVRPFWLPSDLRSHSQRWGSNSRPWEAFEKPNQMRMSIRPKGIQTIHFGACRKTGTS